MSDSRGPKSVPPAQSTSAQKSDAAPLVLVAEDDERTRTLVGQVVQRGGYRVALAQNGASAAKLLKRARPDLIILDLRMPRMDGFQLIELLQRYETAATIPVVILTGSSALADIDRALRLGVADYLVKPISPRKLLTKIKSLLG